MESDTPKKPRKYGKLIRTIIILVLLFSCVGFRAAGYDMSYFKNRRGFVTKPDNFRNTRWVCQENGSFFTVDRHGYCRGEATVDGEPMFFSLDFHPSWDQCGFVRAYVLIDAKNWPDIWRAKQTELDPFFVGSFDCRSCYYCRIFDISTSLSSSAEDDLTLRFVREDLEEEVDFGGPDCNICKAERGSRYLSVTMADKAKAVRLRWGQRLLEMLGPDAPGAA